MGYLILGLLGLAAASKLAEDSRDYSSGSNQRRTYYRTQDAEADYGFSIERQPEGDHRVYIESQPGYGSRDSSLHATHRLSDGHRKYVCWTGRIGNEEEARRVAARWADSTQEYIKTGKRF